MDETFFKLDTLCAHEKPDKNTKKVMKKKMGLSSMYIKNKKSTLKSTINTMETSVMCFL